MCICVCVLGDHWTECPHNLKACSIKVTVLPYVSATNCAKKTVHAVSKSLFWVETWVRNGHGKL